MGTTLSFVCVGERDRKQKISVQRARPGSLWRLHTRFDLIRTDSKRSGRRVGVDRRCRSLQLGFTTSQPQGCTPSRTALREAVGQSLGRCRRQPFGRTLETRMVTRTALREDTRKPNGNSDSPSGGHSNSPSGKRSKLQSLYGVAHIRCQLSGRASPSRASSCRNPDSLSALRNYFAGREREARQVYGMCMRARMKFGEPSPPLFIGKPRGKVGIQKYQKYPHFMSHIKGIKGMMDQVMEVLLHAGQPTHCGGAPQGVPSPPSLPLLEAFWKYPKRCFPRRKKYPKSTFTIHEDIFLRPLNPKLFLCG